MVWSLEFCVLRVLDLAALLVLLRFHLLLHALLQPRLPLRTLRPLRPQQPDGSLRAACLIRTDAPVSLDPALELHMALPYPHCNPMPPPSTPSTHAWSTRHLNPTHLRPNTHSYTRTPPPKAERCLSIPPASALNSKPLPVGPPTLALPAQPRATTPPARNCEARHRPGRTGGCRARGRVSDTPRGGTLHSAAS